MKTMPGIIVIAHNIRSTHNVGSIIRTCEGFGVEKLVLSGYTPYPLAEGTTDSRLPHIADKLTGQIHKTALGAETMVSFSYQEQPDLDSLKQSGYRIVALEQSEKSVIISEYEAPDKIALLLGEEVHGIEQSLLDQCDDVIEIPMNGKKESFNVSVAAGIALYALSI
jgi:23S rRNA (guanosine2251-2'-O)-methyltransferase